MTKKLLIFAFIFTNTLLAEAQLVQVSGFLWIRSDSTASVPYASVINKRTGRGIQSSHDGFYTILMAPNDTVEITAIGYKSKKITLPIGYSQTNYHKNIYLDPDIFTLKEHTVNGITWAKFKEAFVNMEVVEEKKYVTLDPSSTAASAPDKTNFGVALNGPISWLYNKLGKKAREQEKLEDLKQGNDPQMEYTRRITNEFVMGVTKLPEDKVNDFLKFCSDDIDFYAYAAEYDIKAKLLSCLPEFKKQHNITDLVAPENNPNPSDTIPSNPR